VRTELAKASIPKLTVPGSSSKARVMQVIRVVVYVMLVFFFIRGVVAVFVPSVTINESLELPVITSDSAQSQAEAFAKAYYSFDPTKKEAYNTTLRNFIGQGLVADNAGMLVDQIDASYLVRSTLPWRATQTSDMTADIDVRVEVERIPEEGPTEVFYRMLRVPMGLQNGQFYVNDYPTVLPEELSNTGEILAYPDLSEADKAIKDQVKLALDDFFRSYSTDPASKLKYFMADGKELRGYEGALSFEEIKDFRVFLPTDVTQTTIVEDVKVFTTSSWQDDQGIVQLQHHTFDLNYKDERWYLKSIQGGFKP